MGAVVAIGRQQIQRFLVEADATGDGSVVGMLEAWGIDAEDFSMFMAQWTEEAASRTRHLDLAQALSIALVAGFELGYRSHAEIETQRLAAEAVA